MTQDSPPGSGPVVGQSAKVERAVPTLACVLSARRLELHQAGLLRVNGELEARKALRQDRQNPARVVLPLTANDEGLGLAEQKTAPPHPWLDLPLQPFIPHVIQEYVRPQG